MSETKWKCDWCGETFITALGFTGHASREHSWDDHTARPQAVAVEE